MGNTRRRAVHIYPNPLMGRSAIGEGEKGDRNKCVIIIINIREGEEGGRDQIVKLHSTCNPQIYIIYITSIIFLLLPPLQLSDMLPLLSLTTDINL